MFIIPYLVLAAVALLFFFICYMMFFGVSGRKKTADHREIKEGIRSSFTGRHCKEGASPQERTA